MLCLFGLHNITILSILASDIGYHSIIVSVMLPTLLALLVSVLHSYISYSNISSFIGFTQFSRLTSLLLPLVTTLHSMLV